MNKLRYIHFGLLGHLQGVQTILEVIEEVKKRSDFSSTSPNNKTINNDIKFTVEIGKKKLNFLDLTISINSDNCLDFDIYRKPTHTDCIIPQKSNHPLSTKLAAFHSMFNRLLTVPLATYNFNKELHTIIHIATINGYNAVQIHSLLRYKQKKLRLMSSERVRLCSGTLKVVKLS